MADTSEKTVKKGGRGRPFVKGQSGNPGGRPKKTEEERRGLELLMRAAPDVAQRYINMLDSPKINDAVKAQVCRDILDRVYGKATQPLIGEITSHTDNKPMTLEEMLHAAHELIKEAAESE